MPVHGSENIPSVEIDRIEYDSRKVSAGCLFVCMPGARADGHDFAPLAYDLGCRCFLAERKLDLPENAVQFITKDTRGLLPYLSARFYGEPAKKLHLIGITGTKGKTTTSLLVSAILNDSGLPTAYIGSNGVLINGQEIETANTTPESRDLHMFFRMMVDAGIRYVVMEVSSQALVRNRVDGLRFDVTAFLNLSPDHIGEGEHRDFDEYLEAKSRLFTDHGTEKIFYNADDPYAEEILRGATAQKIAFSLSAGTPISGDSVEPYRDRTALGVQFVYHESGHTEKVKLRSPGNFSVYNALAAIGIVSHFGVSAKKAAGILENTSVLGRFQIVDGIPGRTFLIDYAHNGLSLRHALNVLRTYGPRRLICVFGSVGGRTKGRREELGTAAATLADYSIITADNPDFEPAEKIAKEIAAFFPDSASYEIIPDRTEAIKQAIRISREGDIVLFAGKGHERYQLICGKKIPFSEKEIIQSECIAAATIQ